MIRRDDSRRLFRREDTPRQLERNVEEEIAFHVEYRKQQLMARGLSEEEADREARRRFGDTGSVPGVRGVAIAAALPLGQSHGHHDVSIEGYEPGSEEYMVFKRNMISAGYLATMGIEVVAGRGIDGRDRADSLPVAVVNETMARRFWADGDPVGRIIRADLGVARTVVGVIADGRYSSLKDDPEPYICIPMSQATYEQRCFLVAAVAGDPADVAGAVREVAHELDPGLPVPVTTLEEHLSFATGGEAVPVFLIGSFTLLALLLTLVGVYGVSTCMVSQRTREFGLRTALGARSGDIIREVIWWSLRTTLIGLVIGSAASLAAGQVLAASLFRVPTVEPVILMLLPVVTLLVTLPACAIPALWAARVDPVDALRVE